MFNLTENKASGIRQAAVYCLVIYDIVSNKRRVKLVKILEGYGRRVQKSCFEIKIPKPQFRQLTQKLENFYDIDEQDNIIIYHIAEEKVYRYNNEFIQFDHHLLYF